VITAAAITAAAITAAAITSCRDHELSPRIAMPVALTADVAD